MRPTCQTELPHCSKRGSVFQTKKNLFKTISQFTFIKIEMKSRTFETVKTMRTRTCHSLLYLRVQSFAATVDKQNLRIWDGQTVLIPLVCIHFYTQQLLVNGIHILFIRTSFLSFLIQHFHLPTTISLSIFTLHTFHINKAQQILQKN